MKNIGMYINAWCIMVALGLIIYTNGGKNMETAEWVAIGVALLGVAGGIWGQLIQFRKDAQRIESVNSTACDVKKDTAVIKPQVILTEKNVKEIRDGFLKRETRIDTALGSIEKMMEEQIVNERIKQKVSSVIDNPTYIMNAVNLVYERNAGLETELARLQTENLQLKAKITQLKASADIKKDKKEYEADIEQER